MKFIFDMRGFWADERVEGGLWRLSNPVYRLIYKFFKRKELQFVVQSDSIISLTKNAKDEILSWNLKTAPITIVPTCVDLALFNPDKIKKEDQHNLRAKLGIKLNDFVLLYLGSWGTWYLTKEMLTFFSALKKQKPEAIFLIVSTDKVDLEQYEFKQYVIVTSAQRHEIPLHISLATWSVFFIKPSYSKKASSATKLAEILAMQVPITTNKGWGDVESFDFGEQVRIIEIGEPFSNMVLNNPPTSSKAFVELSLQYGIEAYYQVYLKL